MIHLLKKALSVKRPYKNFTGNAFQIFSAARRVFSSAGLIVFWPGFDVLVCPSSSNIQINISRIYFQQIKTKRVLGMVIMIVESAYSAALFVFLILNFGKQIQ